MAKKYRNWTLGKFGESICIRSSGPPVIHRVQVLGIPGVGRVWQKYLKPKERHGTLSLKRQKQRPEWWEYCAPEKHLYRTGKSPALEDDDDEWHSRRQFEFAINKRKRVRWPRRCVLCDQPVPPGNHGWLCGPHWGEWKKHLQSDAYEVNHEPEWLWFLLHAADNRQVGPRTYGWYQEEQHKAGEASRDPDTLGEAHDAAVDKARDSTGPTTLSLNPPLKRWGYGLADFEDRRRPSPRAETSGWYFIGLARPLLQYAPYGLGGSTREIYTLEPCEPQEGIVFRREKGYELEEPEYWGFKVVSVRLVPDRKANEQYRKIHKIKWPLLKPKEGVANPPQDILTIIDRGLTDKILTEREQRWTLHWVAGWTQEEIAEAEGVSQQLVWRICDRAKKKLRQFHRRGVVKEPVLTPLHVRE